MKERTYICCDLKSFLCKCRMCGARIGPDDNKPCCGGSPSHRKNYLPGGHPIPKILWYLGRARLFEVVQKVAEVNARRRQAAPGRQLTGSSWNDPEVQRDSSLALDYIVAPPRMAHYIDWSTKIYGVYLKYLAPRGYFSIFH